MTSSMEKCFLFICLLLLATSSIVQSQFNTGATVNECESLQPAGVTPSTGNAPFIVAFSGGQTYSPGGSAIPVFIVSFDTVNVRGLVIQARRADGTDTTPVGSFALPNENQYRSLTCGTSTTGTLTNTDATTKTLPITLMWSPPATNVGNVNFIVSLVETNGNFWSRITPQNPLPPDVPLLPLTIASCPIPTVQGSTASWLLPACRRGTTTLANSATCSRSSGSTFPTGDTVVTCTCVDQGETDTCTFTVTVGLPPDPCDPNPCENGGTCIDVPVLPDGFICQCPNGMTTPTCPPIGGVCNPNPCQNDGTCSPTTATQSGFVCTCPAGFNLPFCTGPEPPACAGNPCSGNECRVSTNSLAGYTCHSVVGTPCL